MKLISSLCLSQHQLGPNFPSHIYFNQEPKTSTNSKLLMIINRKHAIVYGKTNHFLKYYIEWMRRKELMEYCRNTNNGVSMCRAHLWFDPLESAHLNETEKKFKEEKKSSVWFEKRAKYRCPKERPASAYVSYVD